MAQQVLVDVDGQEPREVSGGREPAGLAGTKTFRDYDQNQTFLLPPSLLDWLPEDHLARVVDSLVEDSLDLSVIYGDYVEERGQPPYEPRMMLKLLVYGYATGVCSSRKIERACHEDVAFRFLAGNQTPDYRSIARFRKRHLGVIDDLFVQVLMVARRAGMTKLGRVALDGTKVRANASRNKAMSYARMGPREQQLEEEIAVLRDRARALLDQAEEVDTAEDERFGVDRRGDELPGELARRETRLAAIRRAKADLEAEAAEAAAEHERDKARRRARRHAEREGADEEAVAEAIAAVDDDAEVAAAAEQAAADAEPKGKAQRNFTDPDARIMKTSDGSFHYCYNGQLLVDEDHQIVLAGWLTNQAADSPHLEGMLDLLDANLGERPSTLLADAGYFTDANVAACADRQIDALIATGRLKHNDPPPPAPRGPIPKDATPRQRMARKLRTKPGRAAYARRKVIAEAPIGQMHTRQGARRLLLRGLDAAAAEWKLHLTAHNILKIFTAGIRPAPAA